MIKVLIVSTSFDEQQHLEEVASQHSSGRFVFETTSSFSQDPEFLLMAIDVLALSLPPEADLQEAYFTKIKRDISADKPMLFLCEKMSPELIRMSQTWKKLRLIKTPIDPDSLFRALVDITTDYPSGQQQVHPRYLTDLNIEVISDIKSVRQKARMKNLSIGGAYFEVTDTNSGFQTGDLVRLSISLSESRSYEFDAKIVWNRPAPENAAIGYGCTFLNKEQVYDALLSQVGR